MSSHLLQTGLSGLFSMIGNKASQLGTGIASIYNDDAKRAQAAIVFNSLRYKPDPNLAQSLENRLGDLRTEKSNTSTTNKTLAYLESLGRSDLVQFVQAGGNPVEALKATLNNEKQYAPTSYAPTFDEKGDEYITVYNPNSRTVERIYTGTTGLSPQATITFRVEEAARLADLKRRDTTLATMGASAVTMKSKMRKIGELLVQIDKGAKSGFVSNFFPTLWAVTAELDVLKAELGLDVISSVTFGALSERELALAMSTAVPDKLHPDELRAWAINKHAAMQKLYVEINKKMTRLSNAKGYSEFLAAEAKQAQEDAQYNYYNLTEEQRQYFTYENWLGLNVNGRKTALAQLL